jgi:cysteine desulfurase family protein
VSGLIYFDNAATAGQRDEAVSRAMVDALYEAAANPGRSAHRLSLEAARIVEDTRSAVAAMFGVADPAHVIFTKNGTEALNLALAGALSEGDSVLASSWEHNAVMRPLRWLERSRGITLEFIPPAGDGAVDLRWLEKRLADEPVRMVVALAASNVTGEILPVGEIGKLCRRRDIFYLVDGAQGAGVIELDMEREGIDALALTGHKSLGGPPGTGALCLKDPRTIEPLIRGGTGSRSEEEVQPDFPPDQFEAGTQNVPGLAGLGAALRVLSERGLDEVRTRHRELLSSLLLWLEEIPGVELFGSGDPERQLATLSYRVEGTSTSEVALELDRRGICSRSGLHCAPRAHRTLGTLPEGTVRFSLSPYNTAEEIETVAGVLREIAQAAAG